MASLSLRAYLQKIENLIDRGETEEAIAHCKHILNKFPKHVDTYRLLGKSYLEMQRYQEASDVLQRVLSVSPDDFVAQIGMSIIREDSENLDEAIWHMERAFEIQPSNNAVQDELKRLYGRRDGAIPQKILLTRGALVRMYVRGEAYPQAIAEGIAALKEEPLRPDIQLLLAKSYLRTNQINDGYRICQKILESLPYSYEANQLIAEIHILTKQSDQAEPYLERVRMLDPYAAFVNENAPTSAKVDENAIIIDELDYDEMALTLEEAQAVNGSKQSEKNFDTSSLEIPTPGDSQPIEIEEDFAWMQEIMNPSESDDQQTAPTPQETTSSEEPDLSELFGDSSEQFDPEAIFSGETQEDNDDDDDFAAMFEEMNKSSETETAQSTGQAEADQSSISMEDLFSSESDSTTDEDLEDFAALFGEQATDTEKSPATDDDFSALFEEQVAQNENFEEVDVFTQSEAQEAIQDIASQGIDLDSIFQDDATDIEDNASSVDTTTQADDSDELPDWLKELDQETKDSDIEGDLQKEIDSLFNDGDLPPSQSAQTESADAKLDDEQEFTAKFLEELENEPQHPGKTRMFSMTADLSSGDSGPLPPLSEVIPQADKTADEEVPDWLKQLEQQTDQFSGDEDVTPQAEQIIQEESAVSTASSLDAMSEEEEDRLREKFKATEQSQNTAQIPADDDEDDSFAWLESLAAKQGAAGVEATPQSAIQADETRVEEPVSETAEEPEKAVSHSPIDAMTEEEEERLREQFKSAQQGSSPPQIDADEDDSFAWLESLAAKQTSSETPVPENAVAEAETVTEEIIEEKTEEATPQKTSTSLDAMTEEEEESLREKFKKSHQTGELTQTVSEKEDDTFAWLESLAAKQGVSEETLLSDRESRDIDTPEWLQESDVPEQIDETTASAALVDEINPIDLSDEITEEEPVTISKLEQAEIVDENEPEVSIDEPVWVDEFASPEPDQADDLVAPIAELPEAQIVENDETESAAVEDADIPVIEQPEQEAADIETSAQKIIEAPTTPDEIPDWLKDLEDQTSVFAMSDEEKAGQGIVDIDDVEIPGWITDVNETLQVELEDDSEDAGDLIPEVQAESFLTDEDTQEDQSAEAFMAVGLDIDELEKQLVEDNIIEHVDANHVSEDRETKLEAEISKPIENEIEEISAGTAEMMPEIVEETLSQTEAEEVVFDIPSDFVNEILQEPEPSGPVLQISEDDNQLLAEMSKLFESNNIADALSIADQLIDKEIYLEKIILELQKIIVDHPLDSSIFIRLGDAYIRNNEIQKALDMYQEAETLLQK